MMKDIRVATIVSQSTVGANQNNLNHMAKWIERAKKDRASIVCFPEMNITGYHNGQDIIEAAETFPGPSVDTLCDMADQMDLLILSGMAEKDAKGNIFASHIVIKPGSNPELYRKIHIAPTERDIFSPGNTVPLFKHLGVTFGIQLCYDGHFPELTTHMALKGADIIFIPHASPRKSPEEKLQSWRRHLTARAYDNSLFIVANNQTGHNGKGLHFPGVAVAINPAGDIMDTYLNNDEGMMVTDIKASELKKVRNNRMHFFLPHRRPEIYNLSVEK